MFVEVFLFCVNDRNVLRGEKRLVREQQPQATNGGVLDFFAGFAVGIGEGNHVGGGFGIKIQTICSGNPNTGLTNTLIATRFLGTSRASRMMNTIAPKQWLVREVKRCNSMGPMSMGGKQGAMVLTIAQGAKRTHCEDVHHIILGSTINIPASALGQHTHAAQREQWLPKARPKINRGI